jgi:hypothetical protein
MLGIHHVNGDEKLDASSVSLKMKAMAKFKHSYVVMDEVHTLSLWSYMSAKLLAQVISVNLPDAIVAGMTGTSVFHDDNKEVYLREKLKLKSNYFELIMHPLRFDVQKLIINLDILLNEKDDVEQYYLNSIKNAVDYASAKEGKVMVISSTNSHAVHMRQQYADTFGADINEFPLILEPKFQDAKQRQENFAILNSNECNLGLASPAYALGTSQKGLVFTLELGQPHGAISNHQVGGRNVRSIGLSNTNFPFGTAFTFISKKDLWSDYTNPYQSAFDQDVEMTGRRVMREMVVATTCGQQNRG